MNALRRAQRESGMWSYTGMVGKASLPRLLEIAGQRMRAEEPVLLGDATFHEHLAGQQKLESEDWTASFSRTAPRPRRRTQRP